MVGTLTLITIRLLGKINGVLVEILVDLGSTQFSRTIGGKEGQTQSG